MIRGIGRTPREGSGSIGPSQCHTANSVVPRSSRAKGKYPLSRARRMMRFRWETQRRPNIYQMSKDKKKSEPGMRQPSVNGRPREVR